MTGGLDGAIIASLPLSRVTSRMPLCRWSWLYKRTNPAAKGRTGAEGYGNVQPQMFATIGLDSGPHV